MSVFPTRTRGLGVNVSKGPRLWVETLSSKAWSLACRFGLRARLVVIAGHLLLTFTVIVTISSEPSATGRRRANGLSYYCSPCGYGHSAGAAGRPGDDVYPCIFTWASSAPPCQATEHAGIEGLQHSPPALDL
jgi:hypothetical protein